MQRCVPVPYAVTGDIMGVFFLMEILTCSIRWLEWRVFDNFAIIVCFLYGIFFCYQGLLSSVNVYAYSYTYSFIDYPS